MNKSTYVKKWMLWSAIILAVIMFILHAIFFKVVEANVLEEVSKRVLMSIGIIVVFELFAGVIFAPLCYHHIYEKRHRK